MSYVSQYCYNTNYLNFFQMVKGNMDSKPLDVKQKELEDFYMTDPISRASSTMAKCVQAVMKQKQSKYYEAEKA